MIENLNDVINTIDNIAQEYKPFTQRWNELADCVILLNKLKETINGWDYDDEMEDVIDYMGAFL